MGQEGSKEKIPEVEQPEQQVDINKSLDRKDSPKKSGGFNMGMFKGFANSKVEEEKRRQQELERELEA